jgi:hypothetical protein
MLTFKPYIYVCNSMNVSSYYRVERNKTPKLHDIMHDIMHGCTSMYME